MEEDLLSVKNFCRRHGIGRTTFYKLLKTGELTAKRLHGKTVVTPEEAARWRKSLPTYTSQIIQKN